MDSILYMAAVEGEDDFFKQQNADQLKVQRTPINNTVLHVAAQFGQTQCVREILHKCGRLLLCSMNIKGETPLHISATEGHARIVQALIDYAKTLHDDVESGTRATKEMLRMRNVEGDTALYEAVRNNNLDVVKILTKEDPEFVHPPNNVEETLLYLAAERCYPAIMFQILENCISQAYNGPNGRTALHATTICYDKECIQILHDWKPSLIKEVDVYGWRPLHYAAWIGNVSAVSQLLDLDKSVAYLVADKDDNMTPFHIAAAQGHIDVVVQILSRCPDCWEMTNSRGQNILHIAVEHRQDKVIKHILRDSFLSRIINQKDVDGNTSLHLLVAKENYYNFKFQIDPKVDNKTFNKKNLNAFEINGGVASDMSSTQVAAMGCRSKFKLHKKNDSNDSKMREKLDELRKLADTQLIVATLIATVTFAAGFTMPGGYDGSKQGMAVLAKQAAFKAFVLTNSIAMVSSVTAVFLLLFAYLYKDVNKYTDRYFSAFLLIIVAMGAMMVAFMTGSYAVLAHSPGLAITVCVICCFFFLIFYVVFKKYLREAISHKVVNLT